MTRHVRHWLTWSAALSLVAASWAAAQQPQTAARGVRRAAKAPAAALPPVADVKLEALRPPATEPPKVTRNPFRFYQPPPPPAPPASKVVRAPEPVIVAPPVPTGPPPPPPITLRFIGLIEAPQRSGRVALLSDGRGGLMSGREGEVIEGRYRVLRVGTDSIDLAYSDGRGRQTIRLSGQ
jgi:hypothetical protein